MEPLETDVDPDDLLAEQVAYYRARAPEYDRWWLRTGRYDVGDEFGRKWEAEKRMLADAVGAFSASGQVLELAAGTGNLTALVAATAEHVTAVDASGEALAVARRKLAHLANVTYVEADLFDWRPPRRYDAVVFGFWLSHVPPGRLAHFWASVREALEPGGRVFFIDNAVPVEQAAAAGGRTAEAALGVPTPGSRTWLDRGVSIRELEDGRRYRIVKRLLPPKEWEAELAALGWKAHVQTTGDLFVFATATPSTEPG